MQASDDSGSEAPEIPSPFQGKDVKSIIPPELIVGLKGGHGGQMVLNNPFETCTFRSMMALVGGYGIGGLFALVLTPEPLGPRGEVVKQPTIREYFKETRAKAHGMGKNFAMVGLVFSAVEFNIESYRGRHDLTNSVYGGCVTGAILGIRGGVPAAAMGCAGFAAFSVVIDSVMGH